MNKKFTFLNRMQKVVLVTLCFLTTTFFALKAATYTEVDGVKYSLTASNKTAIVYKPPTGATYAGEITIPQTITYNGEQYTIVGIYGAAFKGATDLTKITLPATCISIGASAFNGCTNLTNYPAVEATNSIGANAFKGCAKITEAFLPAACKGPFANQEFEGCASLTKFTIMDSEDLVQIAPNFFGMSDPGQTSQGFVPCPLTELYIGRNIGDSYSSPFRYMTTLKSITFGPNVTGIAKSEAFLGCTSLSSIKFNGTKFTSFSTDCFHGCTSLTSIQIPDGVTAIPSGFADGCTNLTTVDMKYGISTIGKRAFTNAKLTITTLPSNLTTIGESAFENALNTNSIVIPNSVTSLVDRAFFNTSIGTLTVPSTVQLGDAVFGMANIGGITIANADDANAKLVSNGTYIISKDNKVLYYCKPIDGNNSKIIDLSLVEEILDYALANTKYEQINFPALKEIGYRAFYNMINLKEFTLSNTVNANTYILEGSGITKFTANNGVTVIPVGTCLNCPNLKDVILPEGLNVIMHNAFAGCTSIKTMDLGKYLNYMESGAIPVTIESITCRNVNVPVVNEELFNSNQGNVVCRVAETAVSDYKANSTWAFLNIIGDGTIVGEKASLGCPTGLYFATKDGELMYQDTNGNIENTGIPAGDHAFQLGAAHNRVYVSYAGKKFTYQSPTAGLGDGELFYLNKAGSAFYRVTLVSNIGYEAFQDPFSMSVDAPSHQLLVADRNVGIHVIDTERPGLYGEQPFLLKNNWLGYYGTSIVYGAIGCGMQRDSEGVYWMGKKFNGNGIFRFTADQIGSEEKGAGPLPDYPILFSGNTITTFTIDEENGYLYAYLQFSGDATPGVYRFNLADVKSKGSDLSFAKDGLLIDSAPVLQEGSAPSELTGITQISSNGTNVYWAYIAPESESDIYIGKADGSIKFPTLFDANNPLHKSGIKYISAKGGTPEVKYAVANVKAYGVAAYVYDPTGGVENNVSDKINANKAIVKGSTIEITADALVRIIALNGSTVSQKMITAGSTLTLDGLNQGLYLIQLNYTDGSRQIVKMVK